MAKKQTWQQKTGLHVGDIAMCDGLVKYRNKSYSLHTTIQIMEIKTNACACLVSELNGEKNITVSILKKYLSKIETEETSEEKNTDTLSDTNENSVVENGNSEEIPEENNEGNEESISEENFEEITESVQEENTEETLEETDIPIEEMIDDKTVERISEKLHSYADGQTEIQVPDFFTEYPMSDILKDQIISYARRNDGNTDTFLDLTELILHYPLKYQPFHIETGMKLVFDVDYTKIKKLQPYITSDTTNVSVAVLYSDRTNEMVSYEFQRVRKNKFVTKLKDFQLPKYQEEKLETYAKTCVKYYLEEEKIRSQEDW